MHNANINEYHINALKIIMIDIFEALNYCEYHGIIHCDLKPENIFFINDRTYNIVIGDFGLSINTNNHHTAYTHNIQTIWYRAPEVIYKLPYNCSIDIWSVGVIILELIAHKPIFKTQKECVIYFQMMYFLDEPNDYGKRHSSKRDSELMSDLKKYTTEYDIVYFKTRINEIKKSLTNYDVELFNFIKEHLLLWDPTKRYSAAQALKFILNEETI